MAKNLQFGKVGSIDMNLKIEIKNLDKIKKALAKSPMTIGKYVNEAIQKSIYQIERTTKPKIPFGASGGLKGSFFTQFSTLRGAIGWGAQYAIFVHEGTRPHWTSVKNLEEWAAKKGINPYAVQRSIARKGTKAQPFLKEGLAEAENNIQKYFAEGLENTLNQIAKEAN